MEVTTQFLSTAVWDNDTAKSQENKLGECSKALIHLVRPTSRQGS